MTHEGYRRSRRADVLAGKQPTGRIVAPDDVARCWCFCAGRRATTSTARSSDRRRLVSWSAPAGTAQAKSGTRRAQVCSAEAQMSRSGILTAVTVALAGYSCPSRHYLPAMLPGSATPGLVALFALQTLCAIAAAVGVGAAGRGRRTRSCPGRGDCQRRSSRVSCSVSSLICESWRLSWGRWPLRSPSRPISTAGRIPRSLRHRTGDSVPHFHAPALPDRASSS